MPPIAQLHTPRLLLRGVTIADAADYQREFAKWEIIRNLTNVVPWPYPDDGAASYLADVLPRQGVDNWLWALTRRDDPASRMIGGIFLHKKDDKFTRGFWLGTDHHGQGYMTEAVIAVMDHAFAELGVTRMEIGNAIQNRASSRIKQKTGARLLRTEPFAFVDPTLTEREVWEVTASDWANFRTDS